MLVQELPGTADVDAAMIGLGTGANPRIGERHAICMVCDFFYPRMGVRFCF